MAVRGALVNHAGDGGEIGAGAVSGFGAGLGFCPLFGNALGGAAFVGIGEVCEMGVILRREKRQKS